jgi:hypothetical protein
MKLLAVAAALLVAANAISISWTGYGGDNQWINKVNWSPDQVPSTGDDVTIASGVVQVTIPTGVNSLVMGTSFSGPANITFFSAFFVGSGGMQVQGNGNVFINSGAAQVSGSITIGGALFFQSGQIGGTWLITSRGIADLSGSAEKAFTGCQFTSQASSFVFGGVMALNQSSQVIVQSTAVFSGDVSIQAQDGTPVLLDTSAGTLTYTGGGDFQIQAPWNVGTFNFEGGNLTIYDTVSFVNPFAIPSGSYVATVGSANVNMTAGVSGSGVLSAAGSTLMLGATSLAGALNIVGGNTTFSAAGTSISILTISGGFAILSYSVSASQLNLMSGNVIGAGGIMAKQLYFSSQGFNLNSAVTVTKSASVGGLLAFGSSGSFTIASTATLSTLASVTFTGVPGMTVTNNGILNVASPVVFTNINLGGSGNATVSSTLSVQTATVHQGAVNLSGAGVFKGSNTQITSIGAVTASPVVDATIGAYSFTCPGSCNDVSTNGVPTSSFTFAA